jgi:hypothetical protein
VSVRNLVIVVLALVLGAPAYAATWKDLRNTAQSSNTLSGKGNAVTWTETGTTDSEVLHVQVDVYCDNTGTTDFTVYRADNDGTKLHVWEGPIMDTASCAAGAGTDTCGSVALVPGDYVFDPDASTASAVCRATGPAH